MLNYKVKIGLVPVRRDCTPRPGAFNWERAEERGRKVVAYIESHFSNEIVSFSDLKGVIDVETLYSENDVEKRFVTAKELGDRGDRKDDNSLEVFRTRLKEFREKTLPVLQTYRTQGLLVDVNGNQPRDAVFNEIVEKLYALASKSQS